MRRRPSRDEAATPSPCAPPRLASALRTARRAGVGAVALGLAALAAQAPAAVAVRAGSYRGALAGTHPQITISFTVSPSGGRVSAIRISRLPFFCPGNGPAGTPQVTFPVAAISPAGSFTSVGRDLPVKRAPGAWLATLTVRGTFSAGGHASGTVSTVYPPGAAHRCGGHAAYRASA